MSPAADDNKRDAILDAALELFAERGFHGTAVPLVAEKAGVGTGTLYRYFENKEALVNALFQRWKGYLGNHFLTDFPLTRTGREQFHWFWKKMTDFAEKHPKAFQFMELHAHKAYLDDRSKELERQILDTIRSFLKVSQDQGILKDAPPNVLMGVVWGAFVGLVRLSWQCDFALTPAALDAAEACVWEAIRR